MREHDNAAFVDVEVDTLTRLEIQEVCWKRDPAAIANEAEWAIILTLSPLRAHARKVWAGALIRVIRRRHSLRHGLD